MSNRYRAPSACELLAALQAGQTDAVSSARQMLASIERDATRVAAWTWVAPDHVLAQARASDARRAQGHPRALEGLPFGVKDVIETAGIPTGMGSPLFAEHVPSQSAEVVRRLEQAGAWILGKTVTTEFATQHPGKTRNPWNPAHTPGGSSSGSAAAVAAGHVPVALGTQTRGSTIRPAAYCGVVGYKPSLGAVPTTGLFPTSHTLDHVGVFARRVADIALVTHVLGALGGDARTTTNDAPIFAFIRSPFWHRVHPALASRMAGAVTALQACGAHVDERTLPPLFDDALAVTNRIHRRELADLHAHQLPVWRPQLSPAFLAYLDEGLAITDAAYQDALDQRDEMIRCYDTLTAAYDAVLTAPADGEAPHGLHATGDATLCTIWTLCGAPAITLPIGLGPLGLPLGLQLVGQRGADTALLSTARWAEGALAHPHSAQG